MTTKKTPKEAAKKTAAAYVKGADPLSVVEAATKKELKPFNNELSKISKNIAPYPLDINKLKYPIGHLAFFPELSEVVKLYGKPYVIIKKSLWYYLVGGVLQKPIHLGTAKTDTRFHLAVAICSGGGKSNLAEAIRQIAREINYSYDSPTSLHPEQLVGKVIMKKRGKGQGVEYIPVKGHLGNDFLVFREGSDFIRIKNPAMDESRRYLNQGLDPMPNNWVLKKAVDIPKEHSLSYCPKTSVAIFFQPFRITSEIVLVGFCRRFATLQKKGEESKEREQSYSDRILGTNRQEESVKIFADYLKRIIEKCACDEDFTFTEDAKHSIIKLHQELLYWGKKHSKKARDYLRTVDYFAQDLLIKCAAIQAASRLSLEVSKGDVERSFVDLTEFLAFQSDYINSKVKGEIDYGEAWMGAIGGDRDCLEALWETTQSGEKMSIQCYIEGIMEIYGVGYHTARKRFQRHKESGWIKSKQIGQHDSEVSLDFKPQINVAQGDQGDQGISEKIPMYFGCVEGIKNKKNPISPLPPSDIKNNDTLRSPLPPLPPSNTKKTDFPIKRVITEQPKHPKPAQKKIVEEILEVYDYD